MRKQYFLLSEGVGISGKKLSKERIAYLTKFVQRLVKSGVKVFYIDLFCGAGGVSTGIVRAGGKVIFCINHDETAIASHEANHKDVPHAIEDIRTFDLTELLFIVSLIRDLIPFAIICLWASTECTHLSKAKGGESRDADSRTLARDLYRYIAAINPDYIDVENVVEFLSWGPLRIACEGKGVTEEGYKYSILKLRKNGEYHWLPESKDNGKYYVDWYQHICREYQYDYSYRVLNSADYGEKTSRIRYFGQFKKSHLPFTWPEATHAKNPSKGGLFGELKPWNACKSALDLTDEGRSIFGRKKDLSPKTYERIYAGLIKYVGDGDEAFMLKWNSTDSKGTHRGHSSLEEPSSTITTQNRLGLAFLSKYYSGDPETKNTSLDEPCHTLRTKDGQSLVTAEFIAKYYGSGGDLGDINQPAGTLTTKDRLAVVNAVWLDKQYSGKDNHQSVNKPTGSILTNDKHCLMNAFIMNHYTGGGQHSPLSEPLGAITTVPKANIIQVDGWLMNHNYDNTGSDLNEPAPTILASRKHYYLVNPSFNNVGHDINKPCFTLIAQMGKKPPYLVEADSGTGIIVIYDDDLPIMKKIKLFMAYHGIIDVKMRMLKIPELLRIQGFGDDYILMGSQTEQKKQIGNAVTPGIAEAKVSARIKAIDRYYKERQAA